MFVHQAFNNGGLVRLEKIIYNKWWHYVMQISIQGEIIIEQLSIFMFIIVS